MTSRKCYFFGKNVDIFGAREKNDFYASNKCQLLRSKHHTPPSNCKYNTRANTKISSETSFTKSQTNSPTQYNIWTRKELTTEGSERIDGILKYFLLVKNGYILITLTSGISELVTKWKSFLKKAGLCVFWKLEAL